MSGSLLGWWWKEEVSVPVQALQQGPGVQIFRVIALTRAHARDKANRPCETKKSDWWVLLPAGKAAPGVGVGCGPAGLTDFPTEDLSTITHMAKCSAFTTNDA